MFEVQAAKTPHATAIASSGLSLTYRQLNRRANQVAHSLRRLGVAPEDRVAIRLERGFDLTAALLGVLKAGAAVVPLTHSWPRARVSRLLADVEPRVLIADARESGVGPVPVNLPGVTVASNLAAVIYTSGSTCVPPGGARSGNGRQCGHVRHAMLDAAAPQSRRIVRVEFRVNLAEVEAGILACTRASAVAVTVFETGEYGQELAPTWKRKRRRRRGTSGER